MKGGAARCRSWAAAVPPRRSAAIGTCTLAKVGFRVQGAQSTSFSLFYGEGDSRQLVSVGDMCRWAGIGPKALERGFVHMDTLANLLAKYRDVDLMVHLAISCPDILCPWTPGVLAMKLLATRREHRGLLRDLGGQSTFLSRFKSPMGAHLVGLDTEKMVGSAHVMAALDLT